MTRPGTSRVAVVAGAGAQPLVFSNPKGKVARDQPDLGPESSAHAAALTAAAADGGVIANPTYGLDISSSGSTSDSASEDPHAGAVNFAGAGYNFGISSDSESADADHLASVQTSPHPAPPPPSSDPDAIPVDLDSPAGSSAAQATPAASPADLVDWTDVRSFLMRPVPPGHIFKCKVYRERSGTARFFPRFYLYLETDDGSPERFLMAARKRKKSKAANYLVSMSREELDRSSAAYLGKVRANFAGTEFVLYDDGDSPDNDAAGDDDIRAELGAIAYLKNIAGRKGPRQMRAILPRVVPSQESPGRWVALTKEASLLARYRRGDVHDTIVLENKMPTFNKNLGSFCLNFNRRVSAASVKNFQMILADNPDAIVLQFGRAGAKNDRKNACFICDFQYPLSPFQAFALSLTSCERKFGLD
ncbi:TULP2 protein [Thecamonas trahens ATCC 50062]|uniref:TULP2 protein n=1 Tax=Thecamonas trahens ATCC 50062 TaxID=461836 RepID=A0A0L0DMP9_THETB|nr:TULP2 protein [Thecamonas trahens ATCC 50062]KNC52683.1 TULP2 protein [Thecamonas trahens ATCC 50062]|eukprot:XP_013755229.1 TULP2 protein [Thecamonas trahens ATCC 50062]